jgi:hypothetical protein
MVGYSLERLKHNLIWSVPDNTEWHSCGVMVVGLRDGNGYPKPETRWVFTLLGYGFGSIFIPMGLLMGINVYPTGSWVRVCSYSTQTHEPVGFLNPTKPSVYCHFIL